MVDAVSLVAVPVLVFPLVAVPIPVAVPDLVALLAVVAVAEQQLNTTTRVSRVSRMATRLSRMRVPKPQSLIPVLLPERELKK